jgi:P27 family predicted phage terminase small subunit
MGERGPAPRPTNIKLLHGEKKSRINLNEPQPRNVPVPAAPEWLSEEARELWDNLMPDLEAMGTLKVSDWPALAALCESWSRFKRTTILAAKSPPIWNRGTDAQGQPIYVKNPLYSQVRDATSELRGMLREFGLTPSARSGLRVDVTISQAADRLFTAGAG